MAVVSLDAFSPGAEGIPTLMSLLASSTQVSILHGCSWVVRPKLSPPPTLALLLPDNGAMYRHRANEAAASADERAAAMEVEAYRRLFDPAQPTPLPVMFTVTRSALLAFIRYMTEDPRGLGHPPLGVKSRIKEQNSV